MGKCDSRCIVCELVIDNDNDKNERLRRTHGGAYIERKYQFLIAMVRAECHLAEGVCAGGTSMVGDWEWLFPRFPPRPAF